MAIRIFFVCSAFDKLGKTKKHNAINIETIKTFFIGLLVLLYFFSFLGCAFATLTFFALTSFDAIIKK